MSSLALRRGRGPAYPDLPPTLQPHAILAAAPPPDLLRTASLSALAYLLLAGGAAAITLLSPRAVLPPVAVPAPRWRPVEIEGPPRVRPVERVVQANPGPGTASGLFASPSAPTRADPEAPAAGLPTKDRTFEAPAAGPAPAGPLPPGPAGSLAGSTGPVIQDFSSTAPAILRRVDPIYPDLARRAHVQGTVMLQMVVDESGAPVQVRVLEGHPALQEAALQAARQWRFEPAQMDGRPVAASFRLTLNFRLR